MYLVSLTLFQCLVHTSVDDSVTLTLPLLLGMKKLIDQTDLFNKISTDLPDQIVEVVGCEFRRIGQPETDVVRTLGIFCL